MWLPLFEAFIEVWLPCGYRVATVWLRILNLYRKSVATRVIKKIFNQVTIEILDLSLSYINCGYRVATIVRGLYYSVVTVWLRVATNIKSL